MIKIVDLCAGIGGVRMGFEQAFGDVDCVLSSEIDKHAQETYIENWGDPERMHGDLFQIAPEEVPDHDILLAGFPCTSYSNSGNRKGLDDPRGKVFYGILDIINAKKPPVVFFENVEQLLTNDNGNSFRVISGLLQEAGYDLFFKVLNTKDFGLPQNRKRVFIVGFRDTVFFNFPVPPRTATRVGDILEEEVNHLTLSDRAWEGFRKRKANNKANGKGFGYTAVTASSTYTGTIPAQYFKDGVQCLVLQNGKNPRKLTPRECMRLQGFPDSFKLSKSNIQAYKQAGNSVSVPVIKAIAEQIKKVF